VVEVALSYFFEIISSKGLGFPCPPIIHIFVIKGMEGVHCCGQLVSKLPNQHFSFESACNIGEVVLLL
jgi:hypothetical protein